MSQTSVSSFYHSRKRGNEDEIIANKQKVIRLDNQLNSDSSDGSNETNQLLSSKIVADDVSNQKSKAATVKSSTRQVLTAQRSSRSRTKQMQNVDGLQTPKLVNFWKGGNLSPQKKSKTASTEVSNNEKTEVEQPGMKTPVKAAEVLPSSGLSMEEIKKKLKGSSRLTELKTSLNKLQAGFDKMDNKKQPPTVEKVPVKVRKDDDETPKQLKPFKTIELEILR
jgi:chromatin licensing and DNA replication factor 1